MSSEGIEEKAVKEILKDTKRAAARAAVGGPQSWTKGNKGKDINKRFLNNTVLSTVYNNSKDKKVKVRGQLTREDKALFKAAEKLKSKEVSIDSKAREPKKVEAVPVRKGKVALSSGSRLQAYLKAKQLKETAEKKKEEREKEEEKAKIETRVVEKPQPYWRPVEEDIE